MTHSSRVLAAAERRALMPPIVEVPVARGDGPVAWPTSGELVLDPVIINDSNFYYRSLGFTWPFRGITKTMLRRAYLRLNGSRDPFLTYAIHVLIDPELRRAYDRAWVGARLLHDPWVWQEVISYAADVVVEAARRGQHISREEVLWSLGIDASPTSAPEDVEPSQPVADDHAPLGDLDRKLSTDTEGDANVPTSWPWGYYLWRSTSSDVERLARWQGYLLTATQELGLRVRLAVGFIGRTSSLWKISRLASFSVVFLHEDVEPTEGMAAAVADELMITTRT